MSWKAKKVSKIEIMTFVLLVMFAIMIFNAITHDYEEPTIVLD